MKPNSVPGKRRQWVNNRDGGEFGAVRLKYINLWEHSCTLTCQGYLED